MCCDRSEPVTGIEQVVTRTVESRNAYIHDLRLGRMRWQTVRLHPVGDQTERDHPASESSAARLAAMLSGQSSGGLSATYPDLSTRIHDPSPTKLA
jgi:hypothetical protein